MIVHLHEYSSYFFFKDYSYFYFYFFLTNSFVVFEDISDDRQFGSLLATRTGF